jgi:hypothetical protein
MPRGIGIILIFALVFYSACTSKPHPPAPAALGSTATPLAALPEAAPLIERLAKQDGCQDSTAEMRLSVEDADGQREQLAFQLQRKYTAERVATLMTVTAPREESDKALLAFERPDQATETLSYLAGLKKLARLTSSSMLSFRGVKVAVQELLGLELSQYTPKPAERVSGGEEPLFKIELTEKFDRHLAFTRIIGFFRERDQSPARFELYNSRGELAKTVRVEEIARIQNYQTMTRATIEDHKQNRKLKLETVKIKYDQALPDTLFNENHLMQIVNVASHKLIEDKP